MAASGNPCCSCTMLLLAATCCPVLPLLAKLLHTRGSRILCDRGCGPRWPRRGRGAAEARRGADPRRAPHRIGSAPRPRIPAAHRPGRDFGPPVGPAAWLWLGWALQHDAPKRCSKTMLARLAARGDVSLPPRSAHAYCRSTSARSSLSRFAESGIGKTPRPDQATNAALGSSDQRRARIKRPTPRSDQATNAALGSSDQRRARIKRPTPRPDQAAPGAPSIHVCVREIRCAISARAWRDARLPSCRKPRAVARCLRIESVLHLSQ
jgi:hypothetical protein